LAYSCFFIALGTPFPNAFGFAQFFLLACNSLGDNPYDLDQNIVKVVGVIVLTVTTLIIYRGKWLGIRLNRIFAGYKVLLLFVAFFAVGVANTQHQQTGTGWGKHQSPKFNPLAGLFLVLFAYQGWETPFAVCRHWMSH
jgi:amino acid transporter